jgi:O-antigen/teichoic acid export membrane protein
LKQDLRWKLQRMSDWLSPKTGETGNFFPLMFNQVVGWFQDSIFRQLFKNASILFSGNVITAIIGLVSMSLTGRALGPELVGALFLIQAYVLFVNALVNFQAWQGLIKYGAEALKNKRSDDFKALMKFGFLLDIGSAVAGTVIAIGAVYWVSQWFGWSQEFVRMVYVYSFIILFYIHGTPTAILRLFNKFKFFAIQAVMAAALKLVGVVAVFLMDGGLWEFLLVWLIPDIVGYLLVLGVAWRELFKQGYGNVFSASLKNITKKFKGIWRFMWVTNFTHSAKWAGQEIDVLMVGAFAGLEATGIYKVAKYFAKAMAQVVEPLDQSIYPDLARLWVEGKVDKFKSVIMRLGAISGAVGVAAWLGMVAFGKIFIDLTVGVDFQGAYLPLVIYMAPFILVMVGAAFRPALLSMGKADSILYIQLSSYAVYFIGLPFLLQQLNVTGAALAQVIFHLVWFAMMHASIFRLIKNRQLADQEGKPV